MSLRKQPVQWAPRVRQDRIRQLYGRDAQGIVDGALIDEVGYALYSRCQSIVHVADAMAGRVHCPRCDGIIQRHGDDPAQLLRCPHCDWDTTWGEYYATYRTQELGAGGARDIFSAFVDEWTRVHAPREKMLLIDRLIHSWHWETRRQRPTFGLGRPTGVNLIEGNRKQVLAFLDGLTYSADNTSGSQATKAVWRGHWDQVKARQAVGRVDYPPRPQPPDPD